MEVQKLGQSSRNIQEENPIGKKNLRWYDSREVDEDKEQEGEGEVEQNRKEGRRICRILIYKQIN